MTEVLEVSKDDLKGVTRKSFACHTSLIGSDFLFISRIPIVCM